MSTHIKSYLINEQGEFHLVFCRGDHGCSRTRFKREHSKKACENCYRPESEMMTIKEVAEKLSRGDA